ncbi:MAG: iron ABC transporter permease [Clostridia bacterium]|nr:iron ABC transporter permease [Clostridia bacterium]
MKNLRALSKKNEHRKKTIAILALLLMLVVFLSLFIGRYPFSLTGIYTVILRIRLPRIAMACLVGGGLSAAGAAYQGVFQNPMASPDILGATQGAAFGAAFAILMRMPSTFISFAAFFFCLLAVFIVWFIGQKTGGKRVLGLILTGIMVGSLFSAGTSFLKLVADPADQLPAITYWLMGSLVGTSTHDITAAFIPIAIGLFPLWLLRWRINILTMGDDEAQSLGVDANQIRKFIVFSATLITAAAVSFTGMIGWVGLVVPHLARRLVGNDYQYLLPASILLGSVFLLLVDNVARASLSTEIPIGILTAFLGAPFFLYLITKGGEKY